MGGSWRGSQRENPNPEPPGPMYLPPRPLDPLPTLPLDPGRLLA